MCGIAGALFEGPHESRADLVVRKMVAALRHRGPDGAGVCHVEAPGGRVHVDVALGHTRLAVIDLSNRASQPMQDEDSPVAVTFNGEIYNFADLRRELERRGRHFRSQSDTEVILQGYHEWGEAVVERLHGMFAFAIWDGRDERLVVARDRLGIKPAYYVEGRGHFLVASEIRALFASGLVEARVEPEALDQYLAYQTTATPRTLIRGVRLLEPGVVLTRRAGRPSAGRAYWQLARHVDRSAASDSPAAARERVGALLADAARRHLVSDVPIGVFLSGGVDSSVLALQMARAGGRPRTFTVSFPGTAWDEGPVAREIARAIGSDHTEIAIGEAELLRELPEALASFDHPSGDGVNTYVVAKAVRSAGLKVAWSGLGGDELFGGYPSFKRLSHARAWAGAWRHAPRAVRTAAAAAVRTMSRPSVATEKAAAVLETDGSLPETFPVLRQVFSHAERRTLLARHRTRLVASDPYVRLLEASWPDVESLPFLARVSYAEARTYMHDVLLRDTDQMSMRHGLEVRVPLLDHTLVEYAMGLSDDVRQAGGGPKALLAASLDGVLPPDVIRRPKRGFVFPFAAWMRTALRPYVEARLLGGTLDERAGLDGEPVRRLWARFLEGGHDERWSRLWTLVALSDWLESNGAAV
jgi:asparagine synthase (glutamine-hydrolysing)